LVCVTAFATTGWIPAISRNHRTVEVGTIDATVRLRTDVRVGTFGSWAAADLDGVRLFLELTDVAGLAGDNASISGSVGAATVSLAGRPHQVVSVEKYQLEDGDRSPYLRLGNSLRSRVQSVLADRGESSALLAGFLVGDVTGVSEATKDAMKLAGLSHFVAVSGSNVAMYMSLVFLMAAPLGVGVRRRALAGLLCLPVFVVATRFEPSVVRASVMAAIVLGSRIFDVGLEVWQVMSIAVVGLLVFDPWLIRSVGFQLSAAATAGVIVGSRWPGVGTGIGRALAITVGAQIAVAPILLSQFGSLPLMSPLSNLIAAPVVSIATTAAVPGVVGVDAALGLADAMAGLVIQIAHMAAGWPQIGWYGLLGVLIAAVVGRWLWRRSPEYLAIVAAVLALALVLVPGRDPGPGTVTVLDVGQGDAILISGGDGHYALVDGGPDEALLLRRLRSYGVRSLDLVVVTHGDADHVAGLSGLLGRVAIGLIWEQTHPHRTSASDHFFALAARHQVPLGPPPVGDTIPFGRLSLRIVGPTRRYQSPNDQSIVILVSGSARSILLTGDIEVVAQNELLRLDYDILKVPHHGGGTSDPSWLANSGASQALISVGDNRFGHPVPWVVAVLEKSGALVERTDRSGSIVVNLNR
jgi:competence protein ComEC